MEVLKTGEHGKYQPCAFDEAACCRQLHCWLCQWSRYWLLSGVNHVSTRKYCENVYQNKSVKITRSGMRVYLWRHSTWKILTGCVVVAGLVTPHPVRRFVGQSLAGLLHIHLWIPICVLSMRSGSLSCQGTFNWPDALEEREHKLLSSHKHVIFHNAVLILPR